MNFNFPGVKLEIKDYCNSKEMRLEISNPLEGLFDTSLVNYVRIVYHCDDSVEVTRETLQGIKYATFEYAYKKSNFFSRLVSSVCKCICFYCYI